MFDHPRLTHRKSTCPTPGRLRFVIRGELITAYDCYYREPSCKLSTSAMPKPSSQGSAVIALQMPVIVLVLAFTAVPMELRPLTREGVARLFAVNLDVTDIVANIVGFVPLGLVFASRGPWGTVGLAACVSLLAEAFQFFSAGRSSGLLTSRLMCWERLLGWCSRRDGGPIGESSLPSSSWAVLRRSSPARLRLDTWLLARV